MKFGATSLLLALLVTPSAIAVNVIECSRPPGGQMTCPDTYAAVCTVKSGMVYGECRQIPRLTGGPGDPGQELFRQLLKDQGLTPSRVELQDALSKGEFKNDVTTIRMKLPDSYKSGTLFMSPDRSDNAPFGADPPTVNTVPYMKK